MNITVLILTYNRQDKLDRAVKSLGSSSLKPTEVLIVDNGSIPNVIQKEYKGLNVKYLRLNTNIGCPAGRHHGMMQVTTEYVYMLDDDGWLEKDALFHASKVFIDLKHRNIGAVRSFVHITKNANIIGKSNREKKKDITN